MNSDLLTWFDDDERQVCAACGERASVTLPRVLASFCLRCGAVTIDGVRVEVERPIAVEAHRLDRPH